MVVGSSTRSLFFLNWKTGKVVNKFQVNFSDDHSISIENVQFPKFYVPAYSRLITFCFCQTSDSRFKLINPNTAEVLLDQSIVSEYQKPRVHQPIHRAAFAMLSQKVVTEDGLPNKFKEKQSEQKFELSRSILPEKSTIMAIFFDNYIHIYN